MVFAFMVAVLSDTNTYLIMRTDASLVDKRRLRQPIVHTSRVSRRVDRGLVSDSVDIVDLDAGLLRLLILERLR